MTIASLLLVLCTAVNTAANEPATEPILLDFHAEWCGPCQKMRPVVKQLIKKNYPVRSVDMDNDPERLHVRYKVEAVPTFIVVDADGNELDRTKGLTSAADLVRFYQAAAAKASPPASSIARVGSRTKSRAADDNDADEDSLPKASRRKERNREPAESDGRADAEFTNPKPWESSVRIRVVGNQSTGFGSGTIIHSTPSESLILTCAHIFHLEGRKQAAPAQFPRKIVIDLFDGKLEIPEKQAGRVHYKESIDGKAVDYDFTRDVGLIRIRPGRQLPASRVVPPHWEPESRMRMLTVGCSEGQDATAWHTQIIKPRIQNFLSGRPAYEAIECWKAPKQGRSGGGLFTDNGYIAGVCDFAEPQGDHGLYATPRSIYHLLDRNQLMALYSAPTPGSGTLVADNRGDSRARTGASVPFTRSQSPDRDEPAGTRVAATNTVNDDDTLPPPPPPTFLNIVIPVVEPDRDANSATTVTRRTNWHPTHVPDNPGESDSNSTGQVDRGGGNLERYVPPSDEAEPAKAEAGQDEGASQAANESSPGSSSKGRWRAVKAAPLNGSTPESN